MTSIIGIDLSTRQLDAATIPFDPSAPQTLRLETLRIPQPKPPDDVTRLRSIGQAARALLGRGDVSLVVVEAPRGPHAARQLGAVYGAVIASVPLRVEAVMALEPLEWRRALGLPARLPKPDAIDFAEQHTWAIRGQRPTLTEHEADALLVALAGRRVCWEAAA